MNMKSMTKTKWSAALILTAALLLGSWPVHAQTAPITPNSLVGIQETGASTLLVPYFEVDLNNPNGRNTIFTIDKGGRFDNFQSNNQTFLNDNVPTAVLAHVTIWSDMAVPVFNFNVYLTGYDVETVNMRNVLNGNLPQTASDGQDPADTSNPNDGISSQGPLSQDINFASCTNNPNFPGNAPLPPATLTPTQVTNLRAALTGNPAPAQCAGRNLGDNVARGYVTVDIMNSCTGKNPGDPGYLEPDPAVPGDFARITNQNHLTGEVFYVDPSNSISRGGSVVHVHSPEFSNTGPERPLVTTAGNYTFYGRLNGFNASDQRQPLATFFGARFNPGGFQNSWRVPAPPTKRASLIVWRDPKVPQGQFACGNLPAWYPLGQEDIVAFDEQENPQNITGNPFPAATQMVEIGGSALPVSFTSGMLFLNLNTTVPGQAGPTSDPAAAQAWVQVIDGKFGVMHNAKQLDSATKAAHRIIIP